MSAGVEALATALADRYRIVRELGAGGMATVYLAEDLKHGRQVAIKVLRPELAAVIGPERFVREIRTIAALQHPHILGLIDSGEVEGTAYYVMPFVEGESLRDRLARDKQLPITDALRIATEVASALDYAHRHGVIHRDIKPENILLHDGQALVADFGIALAASKSGGSRMTETGMSLGTPHYMSPEQAMGEREITGRSDVYALGVVTYEMLTGDPPFTGSTAQAIVARMMTETPRSLVAQRHTISAPVESAVLTALEKLPADRFATAAEFGAALQRAPGDVRPVATQVMPAAGPRAPRPAGMSARRVASLAALLLVGALGGFLLARAKARGPALPMTFGRTIKVTWDPGLEILPAISPDGKSVAYGQGTTVNMQIFVRPVSGGRSIRLTDDTTGIQSHPRWSPDGSRVLFLAGGGVFSAPATGGPARPEVPPGRSTAVVSAAWSPDGSTIAYAVGDSLFLRKPDGTSRPLAHFTEPSVCAWSPNGKLIACDSGNILSLLIGEAFGNVSPSAIVVVSVPDGRVVHVTDSVTVNQGPVWSPDGRWLYFVSSRHGPRDIYAQRVTGSGEPVDGPVRLTTGLGAHTISLSADGRRLAYAAFTSTSNVWAITPSATGVASFASATQITQGSQTTENTNVSRDGQWLYYDSDVAGNMDLYRVRLATGVSERLTTDSSDDFAPAPSPDGREVAFHSWRSVNSRDVFVMPLDGGPVQRVTTSPLQEALATWSPDGNAIVYCEHTAKGGIWIARRTNGAWGQPVRRLDHGYWPTWSPDGTQIVFTTDIIAGSLGVVPTGPGPERIVLDQAGGVVADKAFWMPDGRTLIFRGRAASGGRGVFTVPVAGGVPRLVARVDNGVGSIRGGWSWSPGRMYFSVQEHQSDISVLEVARR